ncbi:LIM domain-binding protein 2-like 1, partial [Homarus americanus]
DVMVVGEPSLMGGEFGDEDERLITRLENTQYDTTSVEDGGNGGAPQGAGPGGPGPGPAGPTPFNNSPMTSGPGGPWPDPSRQPQEADKKSPAIRSGWRTNTVYLCQLNGRHLVSTMNGESGDCNTPVRRSSRARKPNSRFADDELDGRFKKIVTGLASPETPTPTLLASPPGRPRKAGRRKDSRSEESGEAKSDEVDSDERTERNKPEVPAGQSQTDKKDAHSIKILELTVDEKELSRKSEAAVSTVVFVAESEALVNGLESENEKVVDRNAQSECEKTGEMGRRTRSSAKKDEVGGSPPKDIKKRGRKKGKGKKSEGEGAMGDSGILSEDGNSVTLSEEKICMNVEGGDADGTDGANNGGDKSKLVNVNPKTNPVESVQKEVEVTNDPSRVSVESDSKDSENVEEDLDSEFPVEKQTSEAFKGDKKGRQNYTEEKNINESDIDDEINSETSIYDKEGSDLATSDGEKFLSDETVSENNKENSKGRNNEGSVTGTLRVDVGNEEESGTLHAEVDYDEIKDETTLKDQKLVIRAKSETVDELDKEVENEEMESLTNGSEPKMEEVSTGSEVEEVPICDDEQDIKGTRIGSGVEELHLTAEELLEIEKKRQIELEEKAMRNKCIVEERMKSFQHLVENQYIGERKKSKRSKEVRRMVCDCSLTKEEIERGEVGCGEDCLNRLLMIE